MSDTLRPARAPRWWAGLIDRLGTAVLVTITGIVLGMQYVVPNKRVIPVLAALLLFGLTWRVDIVTGIGVLVFAVLFPRPTVFGSTNLAFVLLFLIVWLLRVATRQNAPPQRTPIDVPMVALFICYVLSMYNVPSGMVRFAIERFLVILASWVMFYIIASNLRTSRDLERVVLVQAATAFVVCLIAVFEVTHPGIKITYWLYAPTAAISTNLSLEDIRVGSVFGDYELLCEYCALCLPTVLLLFLRRTSLLSRLALGGLMVFLVFVLFTTATRGGFIALAVGAFYLLWLVRRRVTFVAVTIAAAIAVVGVFAMNTYVAEYTHAGDLFGRLFRSEVQGLVPDTRADVWSAAWQRTFEHPLLGHGPFYGAGLLSGGRIYHWPHSVFLYVSNTIGFVGLAVLVWVLGTLFWISRATTDDLRHRDFARSYLIVANVQMLIFIVDQIKVEYLRNEVYQYQVWLIFALLVAASRIAHAPPTAAPAGGPRETRP